jgi:hypothetical protein
MQKYIIEKNMSIDKKPIITIFKNNQFYQIYVFDAISIKINLYDPDKITPTYQNKYICPGKL